MTATATATRTAKSVAPGAPAHVKVAAGEVLFPVITVVASRSLRDNQEWYEGDGRGYVRDFNEVDADTTAHCAECNERHSVKAFPTFSVPRSDGRTRGTVCRKAIKARLEAAKAPRVTSVRVPQVTSRRVPQVDPAKAMRVARAKKAAAASAKVRSAKAAARKAQA